MEVWLDPRTDVGWFPTPLGGRVGIKETDKNAVLGQKGAEFVHDP